MAYHITLFQSKAGPQPVLTANPASQRDTYFIAKGGSQTPTNDVLINKGSWTSYNTAFLGGNFIDTGTKTYSFWDNGNSEIVGITYQNPNDTLLIYEGSAGNLILTVNSDGGINFAPPS